MTRKFGDGALFCTLALAAVLALVLPAVASAHSLVRVRGSDVSYTSSDATSLNNLTVKATNTDIDFRDPTVDGGIDVGSPCRPGDLNASGQPIQALCTRNGISLVRIDVGEREDTVEVSFDITVQVLGGNGADRLTTAGGTDVVVGGNGSDQLSSGAGNDNVLAGDGDDAIAAGEGNDQVQGGGGLDSVDAGSGDDDIRVRDGARDTVSCGDGTDTVDADSLDEIAGDCEKVTRSETTGAPASTDPGQPTGQVAAADKTAPRVRAGALTVQKAGVIRVFATSSEVGAIAASGYVSIAGVRYPVPVVRQDVALDGGGVKLTLRMARSTLTRVRRALRKRLPVNVRIGVVATDRAGNSSETRAPIIRLRR
jgi:hypothetical protein